MPNYCITCGKPKTSGAFCVHCGADSGGTRSDGTQTDETLLTRDLTPNQRVYFDSEMAKIRKSPKAAFWWAFWLGGIGAHHFYLKNTGRAIMYLLFVWTCVPVLVTFVEIFGIKQKVRRMNHQNAAQIVMRAKTLIP